MSIRRKQKKVKNLMLMGLRTILVIFICTIAFILPGITAFLGLTGAICSTSISYIIPLICYE